MRAADPRLIYGVSVSTGKNEAALSDDGLAATEALMAVSRLMTGVVARSVADVEQQVSLPQFRTLVMLWAAGSMNVAAIAEGLGVNPSNASRNCDKLVAAGLVLRRAAKTDRRHVTITLSARGRVFIGRVMESRRAMFEEIVAGMRPVDQRRLTTGLTALLDEVERSGHAERIGIRPGALTPWVL